MKILIDKGLDVNCADEEGLTPLHMTVLEYTQPKVSGILPTLERDVLSAVKLLVENGANVNAKTSHNYWKWNNVTPLGLAKITIKKCRKSMKEEMEKVIDFLRGTK